MRKWSTSQLVVTNKYDFGALPPFKSNNTSLGEGLNQADEHPPPPPPFSFPSPLEYIYARDWVHPQPQIQKIFKKRSEDTKKKGGRYVKMLENFLDCLFMFILCKRVNLLVIKHIYVTWLCLCFSLLFVWFCFVSLYFFFFFFKI